MTIVSGNVTALAITKPHTEFVNPNSLTKAASSA